MLLTGTWHDHRGTVTMCYEQPEIILPSSLPSEKQMYATMERLDAQIGSWRSARLEEYSRELSIIEQMRNEICHLREKVVTQDSYSSFLHAENLKLKRELAAAHSEISQLKPISKQKGASGGSVERCLDNGDDLRLLIETLEPSTGEHTGLCSEVEASMRPSHGISGVNIHTILKARDQSIVQARFTERLSAINDTSLNMRLFYGGHNLDRILAGGFDGGDVGDAYGLSTFGQGLYFTPYFSKAHHYSEGSGKVLLCLVALGNSETVVTAEAKRDKPGKGFDSICVPGRRLPSSGLVKGSSMKPVLSGNAMEEYVIFHPSQVHKHRAYLMRSLTQSRPTETYTISLSKSKLT